MVRSLGVARAAALIGVTAEACNTAPTRTERSRKFQGARLRYSRNECTGTRCTRCANTATSRPGTCATSRSWSERCCRPRRSRRSMPPRAPRRASAPSGSTWLRGWGARRGGAGPRRPTPIATSCSCSASSCARWRAGRSPRSRAKCRIRPVTCWSDGPRKRWGPVSRSRISCRCAVPSACRAAGRAAPSIRGSPGTSSARPARRQRGGASPSPAASSCISTPSIRWRGSVRMKRASPKSCARPSRNCCPSGPRRVSTLLPGVTMGGFVIVLIILVVIVLYGVGAYNGLISLKNQTLNAFKQIDVQLKRRHDLIPNLVNAVKGAMDFERQTLEAVIQARNQAGSAGANAGPTAMKQVAAAENQLSAALSRFNVVVEQYPQLKATANVGQLQEELTSTENRISFARQAYNDTATQYNTKQQQFPTNMFAGIAKASAAELWEIEDQAERAVPQVDLSSKPKA